MLKSTLLTLQVSIVTKINFLLTISIHCQEISYENDKKITKEKMTLSIIKFSQLILYGNVWGSVWRICTWIPGLKGLKTWQRIQI